MAHQLSHSLRDDALQPDVVELVALADPFGHGALPHRRRTQNAEAEGLQDGAHTTRPAQVQLSDLCFFI